MIAVFALSMHPEGWGISSGLHDSWKPSRAHGYSILYVRCLNRQQIVKVAKRLQEPFSGLPTDQYEAGFMGEWFGGRFDLISIVHCNKVELGLDPSMATPYDSEKRFKTHGDNRFVGFFTAAEVLNQ